jgi:hypothetical protein
MRDEKRAMQNGMVPSFPPAMRFALCAMRLAPDPQALIEPPQVKPAPAVQV